MRGKVAAELRRATKEKFLLAGWIDNMPTMYWQDPRTQVIRRTSTCMRSVYQQAKRNYKGRNK